MERLGHHTPGSAVVMEMLTFGFPVGYMGPIPTPTLGNHPSANNHASHLEAYISKETAEGAMLGLSPQPPFYPWCQTNPLLTRPKKDSRTRRIIMDLSWPAPPAHIILTGAHPDRFTWTSLKKMHLPSPPDMATLIKKAGAGSYLYCRYIAREYHQLQLDPADWPLVCFVVDHQYYADISLPFS